MSAFQRSSRSRLKTRLDRLSPSVSESPTISSTSRGRVSVSQAFDKRKSSAHEEIITSPLNDSTHTDAASNMDHEDLPSPVSNASSSSLSELEDVNDGVAIKDSEPYNPGDVDSEAETERMETSPQKLRGDSSTKLEAEPGNRADSRPVDHVADGGEDTIPAISLSETSKVIKDGLTLASRSGVDLVGKKRKRTSSATISGTGLNGAPAAKRSASSREASRPVRGLTRIASVDEVAVEEESAENLSDISIAADPDEPIDPIPTGDDVIDDGSDEEIDDQMEEANHVDEMPGSVGEIEDSAGVDETEDAAEAAARSEDEAAKKKAAMESLKPLENFFAIFRDRIYDEKLARLSAELDLLKQPITSHADFLAMRQCIDTRRDEKIQLEKATLGYKLQALENRCVAERAQLHSQYFQSVRDIRETHIENIGEQQSRMKREMRQLNKQQTDFQFVYNPKRALQVRQQQAYNTEVSILSGIARYQGFPAAPEIEGLRQGEVEEDLRHMKLQATGQPSKLNRLLAKSRAVTSAAEEQFLEQTPWANPNHPAVQHAVILERQVSALQPLKSGSYIMPTTTGWMADFPNAPNVTPVALSNPNSQFTTEANSVIHSRSRLSEGRPYEMTPPLNRSQIRPLQYARSPPVVDEILPNGKGTATRKPSQHANHSDPAMSQIFSTTARSDQLPEIYENSAYAPRPVIFGTPRIDSHDSANTGEVRPVKREDEHERFNFTAIPARDPHFTGGALPAGIAMERFELR